MEGALGPGPRPPPDHLGELRTGLGSVSGSFKEVRAEEQEERKERDASGAVHRGPSSPRAPQQGTKNTWLAHPLGPPLAPRPQLGRSPWPFLDLGRSSEINRSQVNSGG